MNGHVLAAMLDAEWSVVADMCSAASFSVHFGDLKRPSPAHLSLTLALSRSPRKAKARQRNSLPGLHLPLVGTAGFEPATP
jgi:hypothetical protein